MLLRDSPSWLKSLDFNASLSELAPHLRTAIPAEIRAKLVWPFPVSAYPPSATILQRAAVQTF